MAFGGKSKKAAELSVRVITPDATVFDESVAALTSVNKEGEFTILPQHINFISLVKERVIITRLDGSQKKIPLELGILRALNGAIEVFVGLSQVGSSVEERTSVTDRPQ